MNLAVAVVPDFGKKSSWHQRWLAMARQVSRLQKMRPDLELIRVNSCVLELIRVKIRKLRIILRAGANNTLEDAAASEVTDVFWSSYLASK